MEESIAVLLQELCDGFPLDFVLAIFQKFVFFFIERKSICTPQPLVYHCLLQVFKDWLMEIVCYLNNLVMKSATENGKRISLVLIVLDLLHKISGQLQASDFAPDEIQILFSMLALRPDLSKSGKCPDLNDVMNFIPQNYRKHVAADMAYFVNRLLPSNHLESTEWVYLLPLMHALDGKVDRAAHSGKVKWEDNQITLSNLGKPVSNAVPK